ncbi:hypothetical protein [Streptomyces peucetius]|uniref:Uncharacterized protein n=1 Tax=Streptomyces peucetius TaxID=1950 RepID=A0ABY6I4U6_STRPE|nr:hypothetical protein [Streptomyces peucetius]UYQ61764.1 hypothetical protein OGH68_09855 [Streptomyces peucetius]
MRQRRCKWCHRELPRRRWWRAKRHCGRRHQAYHRVRTAVEAVLDAMGG